MKTTQGKPMNGLLIIYIEFAFKRQRFSIHSLPDIYSIYLINIQAKYAFYLGLVKDLLYPKPTLTLTTKRSTLTANL